MLGEREIVRNQKPRIGFRQNQKEKKENNRNNKTR